MWNPKLKTSEHQNRDKLRDTENTLKVTGGRGGGCIRKGGEMKKYRWAVMK